MSDKQRILIIKPSSLGDIVHALPVLAALRDAHPQAHIAWLVGRSFAPLLEGHPLIDEIIPFDRARFGKMWRSPRIFIEFWKFIAQLRARRFDLVIDLQGLIRSGLMTSFSGAARTIGFANSREAAWLFYKTRVHCPESAVHAVDRNLCVARELGLPVEHIQFPLALREDERNEARQLLRAAKGAPVEWFTAVIPGARWESKLWPAERFVELIDRVQGGGDALLSVAVSRQDSGVAQSSSSTCVLLGAPGDRALADRIVIASRSKPIDLVGKTSLRQLVALIALADRVVCCDSGPMHIAAALNKPIAAIFGPTNPARTGPYSPRAHVAALPLPCSPCYRRICPLGHHNCMNQLGVDQVLATLAP